MVAPSGSCSSSVATPADDSTIPSNSRLSAVTRARVSCRSASSASRMAAAASGGSPPGTSPVMPVRLPGGSPWLASPWLASTRLASTWLASTWLPSAHLASAHEIVGGGFAERVQGPGGGEGVVHREVPRLLLALDDPLDVPDRGGKRRHLVGG